MKEAVACPLASHVAYDLPRDLPLLYHIFGTSVYCNDTIRNYVSPSPYSKPRNHAQCVLKPLILGSVMRNKLIYALSITTESLPSILFTFLHRSSDLLSFP